MNDGRSRDNIRVLMAPDWRGNPYLTELARGLAESGATTGFDTALSWKTLRPSIFGPNSIDVLHLHWAHPYLLGTTLRQTVKKSTKFLTKLILLRLTGTRIVWTVHNLVQHDSRQARTELFLNRLVAKVAHSIIAQSEFAKGKIQEAYRIGETKIAVIPHGNYLSAYPMQITKEEARGRLGIPNERFVFLYFGAIRPYKGVSELLEAFSKFSIEAKDVMLMIVGRPMDDVAEAHAKQCAANNPKILVNLEFVPTTEVQTYMFAADIMVLPYRRIFTSGSLKLAMSFGLPVVAPKSGSILEFIGIEGGLLYAEDDPEGLLRAMASASSTNPAKLRKMGRRNRKLAATFDWETIGELTAMQYRRAA